MKELAEFERYMAHLCAGLGHSDRHAGLRGYCSGLMAPLQRKSVEPMAAHLAPGATRSRHQSFQTRLDIAQRFAERQLRECHRVELIQAGEALDLVLAVVASDAAPKRRQRQMRHHLREHELVLVHRRPERDSPAKGGKSAA